MADFLADKQERILHFREQILAVDAVQVSDVAERIRGWEGNAGRHYFEALSRAIPTEFAFRGRSFRPAHDPFNAALNYAYGILYSRTERALMLAGLDPYLGFLHRDDYNLMSLVFDFIEPYRIHAERCVFGLFARSRSTKSTSMRLPTATH